jgi:ADP-ribosyl-[dinitrogen reductase] hydrolase
MSSKVIGAIVGDIVGSIYEFNNIKTKDFPLFSDGNEFTDDSIMTIATMQALLDGGTAEDFVSNYQRLGNKYPSSYGVRFGDWLRSKEPLPYDSWGNGSAMRVSAVAWFYDNPIEVEEAAKTSAKVTHNHPEGIKGAVAIAAAIFMARTGKSKREIKNYLETRYEYILDFTLDDIRPNYDFDESCAGTVPPAIIAFLEGVDFEDSIRNAVSLGGDSDTLAAITGSIAEAFYSVPDEISTKLYNYLPDELENIVERFNVAITRFTFG